MAENNVITGAQVGNKDYQFQDESIEARVSLLESKIGTIPQQGQAPNLSAVINNVNLLAAAHNELLGKLAKLAYNTDNVPSAIAMTWPEPGDEPTYVAPELYSPALNSVIDLGIVAVGDSSVTRTITFRGSTGIVQDILLSIDNDSRFVLSTNQLSYQDVINGTASVSITYSGEDANAECVLLVTGGVTGTITLRASIASEDDVMYSIDGTGLSHCSLSNSGDVKEGDEYNSNLVADSGYAFDGVTAPVVTMDGSPLGSGSGSVTYNQLTGNWAIHINSVTGDIAVSASAVKVHKITIVKSGCTHTSVPSVLDGGNVVATFTPSTSYTLSEVSPSISGSVTSSDVTLLSNGKLQIMLYGVSSDITITVTARSTIAPDVNPDEDDTLTPCHKYLQRLDPSTPGVPNYEGLPIMQDEAGDVDLYNKSVFDTISSGFGNTKRVNSASATVDGSTEAVPTNGQALQLLADPDDDGFSVLVKSYAPYRNGSGKIPGSSKTNIWISFTDARGTDITTYRSNSAFDNEQAGHFLLGVTTTSGSYSAVAYPYISYHNGSAAVNEFFMGKSVGDVVGETYDILFVYNKETNEVSAYVDGVLAGSVTPTAELAILGLNMTNRGVNGEYFSHSGVSFYNRMLTAQEIAAMWPND